MLELVNNASYPVKYSSLMVTVGVTPIDPVVKVFSVIVLVIDV